MKTFKPSPQQEVVFDWVRNGKGSLNLIAYAGTGKTTTLMEIAKIIKGSAFMGAFNKAIADEFVSRLKAQGSWHVKGGTMHSAGFAAWRGLAPGAKVEGGKMRVIAKGVTAAGLWDRKLVGAICETVSYAKQACLGVQGQPGVGDEKAWKDIIDFYDMRDEIPGAITTEAFIQMCIKAYRASLEQCEKAIDFDDMLLAPLFFKAAFKKYEWVMIDEAQDTNTARRLIAYAMMHEKTRMVAVGDPHQAIYGFAGATADAMDVIKRDLNSSELPLSVTYRCPVMIVEEAKTWVPKYEAHESAPLGKVTTIKHTDLWEMAKKGQLTPDDVILCRNTRPLVGVAGRLRELDIPCMVEGASTKGLIGLATKWDQDGDALGVDAFLEKLDAYQEVETARLREAGKEAKADSLEDRCETLRDLCGYRSVKTTADLVNKIDFLFGDNSDRDILRLCTVHRSKGREWGRVFVVGMNRYMPSKWAKKDWELAQEDNLCYVAVTRAKVELVKVAVPMRRKDGTEWWEGTFVNRAEDGEVTVYPNLPQLTEGVTELKQGEDGVWE